MLCLKSRTDLCSTLLQWSANSGYISNLHRLVLLRVNHQSYLTQQFSIYRTACLQPQSRENLNHQSDLAVTASKINGREEEYTMFNVICSMFLRRKNGLNSSAVVSSVRVAHRNTVRQEREECIQSMFENLQRQREMEEEKLKLEEQVGQTFHNNKKQERAKENSTTKNVNIVSHPKETKMIELLSSREHQVFCETLLANPPHLSHPISLPSFLQLAVFHVYKQNIKVNKVSLETKSKIVTPLTVRPIYRQLFSNDLPKEIITGRYTKAEDKIILKNWNELRGLIKVDAIEEEVREVLFENSSKSSEEKFCKNIIGYFLSQGLTNTRLAADVFNRLRIILSSTKIGKFSPDEDKKILKHFNRNIEEGAEEMKEIHNLAISLGRNHHSVYNRYFLILKHKDKQRVGKFSVDESKLIIKSVFACNENVLNDGMVLSSVWENIGQQLNRKPRNVYTHWITLIHPLLLRFHSGTLEIDYFEVLILYMLKNNLQFPKDVNWKEVSELPEFLGTTGVYLHTLYCIKKCNAVKLHRLKGQKPVAREEFTAQLVFSYWTETSKKINTQKQKESIARKTKSVEAELIEFYKSFVLTVNGSIV